MAPALTVGLTGGIASGKSTVARQFAQLGVPVVDADAAARAVVEPGTPGLEAIRTAFSDAVLTADGRLDRARLRAMVFDDPQRRHELEAILHPLIREWMDLQVRDLDAPYVIRVVPLLVETGQHRNMDRVLVVDVSEELQRRRALQRDGGDPATIDAILAAQVDRQTRLAAADDVIRNDGGPEALASQVWALHQRYMARARQLREDQRK